jgi:protease I
MSQVHFYPRSAIGGGSIADDWQRHREEAATVGCAICGIEATKPVPSTGSHSLVSRLDRRPLSLDPRGTDYPLPQFGEADANQLKGLRALMLLADGGELPEIIVPLDYLRARGATVDIVGQNWIFEYREPAGAIVLAQWMADDFVIKADKRMADVDVSQYDLLIIPGGAWNPIMLSTDGDALRLVRKAREQGLLLASLCHGPQVIAHAAFDAPEGEQNFPAQGVNITAAGDVRLLLQLAGFVVHGDRATVFDPSVNLLTSRDPNDLQAFCQEIGRLGAMRLAARSAVS